MANKLARINRVAIAGQTGSPVWDQVETYSGITYQDLEMTADSSLEATQPRIETTGQRGDGEMPLAAEGNRDASISLAFYMRGLDLSGGAANAVSASTASPQYNTILTGS